MQRLVKADRTATIQAQDIKLDVSKVSVTAVISTEGRDRSEDIVVTTGVITEKHAINPVVLLEHQYPIGVARTPEGVYTVEKHNGIILGTTYFDQGNPLSVEAFRMIDAGILNGASIGFVVRNASVILATPGRVQINDVDGDRVPVDRFGLRYDEVELVEYSHTILPDNPEALTVAVQKSRVGGAPMSSVMKRFLSPYVIETPESVSVPAQIETVVKGATMQDGYIEEKPNPDPNAVDQSVDQSVETETPPVDESEDTGSDLPPGAQLLTGVYDRLLELAQFLEDEGGSRKQENPDILAFVDAMIPQIDELCSTISDSYDSLYPDLDSLNAGDEMEPEPEPDPEDPEESEGKRTRRRLSKRIQTYRKNRVGLKPIEVPVKKADVISREEYAQVMKQYDKLEKNYLKLLKQIRTFSHR